MSNGSYTAKLNLFKPAVGSVQWGEGLNHNLDVLDNVQLNIDPAPNASFFFRGDKSWGSLTTGDVTGALGFTPIQSSDVAGLAYDALSGSIGAAVDAANAASYAASKAAADAASALADIADIANDNLLTPVEKSTILKDVTVINAEKSGLDTQATSYGITTEKASYDGAVDALNSYLATLTSPTVWNDLNGNTTIVGTTFRTKFTNVYNYRQVLLNKIYAVIKTVSEGIDETATKAASDAAQAASDAAKANAAIADIASDNVLASGEKSTIIQDVTVILGEQSGIDAKADTYQITTEKASYDAAITALNTYLSTLTTPKLWSDTSGNTNITGTTFRSKFADVYTARQVLLNAIYGKVKTLTDAAKSAADAAKSAADTAQSDATKANNAIGDMASDGILSPVEKPAIVQDVSVINAEKDGIDAQATLYGITTEKTAYDTSITTLTNYLATLTSPVLWSNTSGNTAIDGPTFRAKFAAVYTSRQALLNKIADIARALANQGIDGLDVIGNDSILSRGEKQQVIIDWSAATAEKTALESRIAATGVDATDYRAAYNTLHDYLVSLSPAWDDTTKDTMLTSGVTGSSPAYVWQTLWSNLQATRQALVIRLGGASVPGVFAVSSGNVANLTTNASLSIDGYTLTSANNGATVMLAAQSTKSQNGLYSVVYTAGNAQAATIKPSAYTLTGGGSVVNAGAVWDSDPGSQAEVQPTQVSTGITTAVWKGFPVTSGTSGTLTVSLSTDTDGNVPVDVSYSTDGGNSWTAMGSYTAQTASPTASLSNVDMSQVQVKVLVRAIKTADFDPYNNITTYLIEKSWAYVGNIQIATTGTSSANYALRFAGVVADKSAWRVANGTTYGGKNWITSVGTDNTVSLSLSPDQTQSVPLATATTAGIVKVGTGLSVAQDGTLSATATGGGTWGSINGTLSAQTDLQNALNAKVSTGTTISAGTGLTGGGDLSTNRALSVNFGTTSGTVCQGNDSRLSDARPASDVYAWAKASSKPGYSAADVGALASNAQAVDSAKLGGQLPSYYYAASNPSGYITGITSGMVTTALGFTPYNSSNPSGFITGINSSMVTNALGYTPYNSSNPSGFITSSGSCNYASSAGSVAWGNVSGRPSALSSFSNDVGYITGISSGMVTSALGYTPAQSGGYITGSTLESSGYGLSGGLILTDEYGNRYRIYISGGQLRSVQI